MRRLLSIVVLLLSVNAAAAWTDRYVSSAAGGGGDGSIGNPWTLTEAAANAVAGDRINVKADGTYSLSAELTPSNSGNNLQAIWWRGYSSTIGDGGRPDITRSGTGYVRLWVNNGYSILESLHLYTSGTRELLYLSGRAVIRDCVITNPWAGGGILGGNYSVSIINSFLDTGGTAILTKNTFNVVGCYIDAPSPIVAGYEAGDALVIAHCLIVGNGGSPGIDLAGYGDDLTTFTILHNTIVNNTYGIRMSTSPDSANETGVIANNLIWGCSNYGIYNSEVGTVEYIGAISGNAIGNVTLGEYYLGNQPIYNAITLGSNDPFVDSSGGDYRIAPASTGGALVKGTGQPTDIDLDGTQDNWSDVGALQHEDAGGGGTTLIIVQED